VERLEFLFRSVPSQATINKLVVRHSISLERRRLSCNVTSLRYKKEIVATVTMSVQFSLIHCQLTVKSFLFLLYVVR
jgi:hypothetical protein